MARWFRQSLSVSGPFVCRCLTSSAMLRFHIPLIELDVRIFRIQLSDEDSWVGHAMPSEASERFPEFLGLHPSPRLRFFRHAPRTKAPSLHRHYAVSRVLRASPSPQTVQPASHEVPVDPYRDLRGGFPCCDRSPCACMPSPLPRQEVKGIFARLPPPRRPSLLCSYVGSCITVFEACSAFTHVTACLLAGSPKVTSSTRGFSRFIASTAAPVATGWSDSCRMGFAPTEDRRLFTAHCTHGLGCG